MIIHSVRSVVLIQPYSAGRVYLLLSLPHHLHGQRVITTQTDVSGCRKHDRVCSAMIIHSVRNVVLIQPNFGRWVYLLLSLPYHCRIQHVFTTHDLFW